MPRNTLDEKVSAVILDSSGRMDRNEIAYAITSLMDWDVYLPLEIYKRTAEAKEAIIRLRQVLREYREQVEND